MNSVLNAVKTWITALFLGWVCTPLVLVFSLYMADIFLNIPHPTMKTTLYALAAVSFLSPLIYGRLLKKRKTKGKKRRKKKKTGVVVSIRTPSGDLPRKKSKKAAPARMHWLGAGEALQVGAFQIRDPLTYYAKGKAERSEPSCIDITAKIGAPKKEESGRLGYWPSFAGLSKVQKANYLAWLAAGREEEVTDIGYAFIFFYGLERRCLIDDADHQAAMTEVCRLLQKNRESKSFSGYLSRFLVYLVADLGMRHVDENGFTYIFERTVDLRYDECFNAALAWFYENDRPLPAAWALSVAERDPRSPRSVVPGRVPDEYHRLFEQRYTRAFGRGLRLEAAKRPGKVEYVPASAALRGVPVLPVELPDVPARYGQFTGLIEIRNQCIDELKKLSRLALKGDEVTTREAYDALPDALKQEQEHPDAARWIALLDTHRQEEGCALVPVSALAKIQDISRRDRLTKKQGESLCETADHVGLGMEPDARLANRTYRWDQTIALFRQDSKPDSIDLEKHRGASLVLELGIGVAAADGTVHREEVDHISRFIEGVFNVGPDLAKRLLALKSLLVRHPPVLTRIAARLKKIDSEDHRSKVGEFVLGVAASDGKVTQDEIKVIRRLYKALDIPAEKLDTLIAELKAEATAPVEVKKAKAPERKGEPLPPAPEPEPVPEEAPLLELDPTRIREIMTQTREVAAILGKAMGEITDESEEEASSFNQVEQSDADILQAESGPLPETPAHSFEGLDARYHPVLDKLLKEPTWDRQTFDELIRQHALMPDATIAILNDWAEEQLGDFLIEDDEPITINLSLLEESS